MKKLLIVLACVPFVLWGQGESETFDKVDQMPLLANCENEDCTNKEIMNFIANNFHYPELAKASNIEGKLILYFIVEKDGSVNDVQLIRGIDSNIYLDGKSDSIQLVIKEAISSLHNESINLLSKLVFDKPGIQNNKAVRVRYTIPIKCKLS
jgi:protein TonB